MAVARFEFVVARFEVRVEMLPVAVESPVWSVRILPVAVERLVVRSVFVPWSFPNAERTESVAVTVPALEENPARSDVRFILPEKVL